MREKELGRGEYAEREERRELQEKAYKSRSKEEEEVAGTEECVDEKERS